MSYKQILREIQRGKIFPLYLFFGEDEGRERRILSLLKEKLFKSKDEIFLNYIVVYGGEVSWSEVIKLCEVTPFLSKHRLIVVRDAELLGDFGQLEPYIYNPSKATVLVLKVKEKPSEKIQYAIRERGRVINFWPLFPEEVPSFIKEVLNREGKSITPKALAFFTQNVSTTSSEIENKIEKLLLYVGEKSVIDEGDVKEVIGIEVEGDIFDLLDAIGRRETGGALLIFSTLKQRREPLLRVLSMIAEHLRLIWQTKIYLEGGKRKSTIANLLKIKSKRKMDALVEQSSFFSHTHLRRCFEKLLSTDLSLKSKEPKVHPLLMELLILYITGKQNEVSFLQRADSR